MTTLIIRTMTPKDVPAIYGIEQIAHPEPWSEKTFYDSLYAGFRGFVLEKTDEILGYVLFSVVSDESHILNIAVLPERQNKGYGTHLLKALLEVLQTEQIAKVTLEVNKTNHAALALYGKFGFVQKGVRKEYYVTSHGKEDAYTMLLELSKKVES